MMTFIRQSTHQLRLWLIAATAMLAFISVLEAGHAHGVASQIDEQCALCQHSVALDKIFNASQTLFIPLLLAVFIGGAISGFIPSQHNRFALIRAPPSTLHIR